jgi:DNA processing protein
MLNSRYVIALLELPGIGRKTVSQFMRVTSYEPTGTAELREALDAASNELPRIQVPSIPALTTAIERADQIIDESDRLGLTILVRGASQFPARLASIPDPPVMLFAKGDIAALSHQPSVAVIGTREPTSWGAAIAQRFGQRFAEKGCVVVSGLAIGCDAAAHRGCLFVNGITIAVLAHGLHTIYPAEHRPLAAEILEKQGCLVSEYAPGVRGQRSFFVERDRLQSGLSAAVVVVETDITGGTMHTVKACQEQGRLLACLAHPEKYRSEPKTRGNQFLIREGKAIPLADIADIEKLLDRLRESDAATTPAVQNTTPNIDHPMLF